MVDLSSGGPTLRQYRVMDVNGQIVLECDRINDLRPKGAADGLLWERGQGPFIVFCKEHGSPSYGYIGVSEVGGFINDNINPDYSVDRVVAAAEA